MELYITLGIIAIGIFLFVKDYFSIDTTSLLIMALFIVTGVLSYEEGFAGFNHPATITLGCMFVVSGAVFKTGIIDSLSIYIIRAARIHYIIALVVFCLISAIFSAFVNDAAVVALLIPMVMLVCRETGIAPSKLLIPVAFASLFGGTCTLIGTSTNILVSSYAEKSGLVPFGMFEFALPALCLLGVGFAYIFIFGPIFLPKREQQDDTGLAKEVERYVVELRVTGKSGDIGKQVARSSLVRDHAAQIITIQRSGQLISEVNGQLMLEAGDVLKVMVSPERLQKLKQMGDHELTELGEEVNLKGSETDDLRMYEVMVPVGSGLAGRSLLQSRFSNIYRARVLGIRQHEAIILTDLANLQLREGDLLLLHATEDAITTLTTERHVIVLSQYDPPKVNYRKAIPALLIAAGVVTAAALGVTSILISGMVGCLLIVTTGILKPKEAYEAIEWKVIFMMAGVLSMGIALEKTGGSDIISGMIFNTMGQLDPRITLSLIFLVTFLSTNVLSSKATAALMAPIVISLSTAMGVSERPMLIAVMFACSLTFMTPMSYPVNTMVYGPGNYVFKDFLRFGTPLNIIIWITASVVIPLFFPF
jgi:di/tricarboxylate transporter